ncbi:MAG: polysaccharide deacetylase family protein [Candidatus Dormibacteria bacterium]
MKTNVAAEASLRDTLSLASFLVVVALCISLSLYLGLRLTHGNPGSLLTGFQNRVVVPASARSSVPAEAPAPPVEAPAPPTPQKLEVNPAPPPEEVITHGDRSRPMVALTFDSNMTPLMLDELRTGKVRRFVNDAVIAELRDLKVPATFFLAGLWIEHYPEVARDLAADPLFEVGSHSYSHQAFRSNCFSLAPLDLSRAADDLDRNQTLLEGIAAHPTRFFRFPGGCYDAAALAAIRPARVQVIQYDVISGDAFATDPARVVAETLGGVQNGSIVVMHITGGNTAPLTDRVLPGIVKQLRAKGFQLVRLGDLLHTGAAR